MNNGKIIIEESDNKISFFCKLLKMFRFSNHVQNNIFPSLPSIVLGQLLIGWDHESQNLN